MSKSERLRNLIKRVGNKTKANSQSPATSNSSFQWRPFIALIGVYVIFIMGWQWAWGILFLYWVIPDMFRGVTYFIEPVERQNNPFLFWLIVISWILMSLVALSTLFIDYNNLGSLL